MKPVLSPFPSSGVLSALKLSFEQQDGIPAHMTLTPVISKIYFFGNSGSDISVLKIILTINSNSVFEAQFLL